MSYLTSTTPAPADFPTDAEVQAAITEFHRAMAAWQAPGGRTPENDARFQAAALALDTIRERNGGRFADAEDDRD